MIAEGGGLRTALTARHRRVEHAQAFRPALVVEPRARLGEEVVMSMSSASGRAESMSPPCQTCCHVLRVLTIVMTTSHVAATEAGLPCQTAPLPMSWSPFDRERVVDVQLIAGGVEMPGHGRAHDAEPDEADFFLEWS